MKFKDLFQNDRNTGLIREFDDNYYDKIRVYKSRHVTDTDSAADYALMIRSDPRLHIRQIFFEDLQLRDALHPGDRSVLLKVAVKLIDLSHGSSPPRTESRIAS